ncbi:MAG: hypothetical protein P8171_21055 [Candidatus Thiodiazotropha sp.]
MTAYRLNNNIFEYSSAYVDFRALRRQFKKLSVEFSQNNESLISQLSTSWLPVDLDFQSDTKNKPIPDLSIWNMSCLVLNKKAKQALTPVIQLFGEFLPLENDYYLFNCLTSLGGDAIDVNNAGVSLDDIDPANIPKTLTLLPEKITGVPIFKPGFALNTFLVCQDDFKDTVISAELNGLLFEKNLAQLFPRIV